MSLFRFLYPTYYPSPYSTAIELMYFTFFICIFVITFINFTEIEKLKMDKIDTTLYTAGSEFNILKQSDEYTRIYRLNTDLYNFSNEKVYTGYFRIIFKDSPSNSSVRFRVTDNNSRNITLEENNQIVQSNMVVKFKTINYTPLLDLNCKITESNMVIESISIFAEGSYVKGLL
jgi:hypothetical protein